MTWYAVWSKETGRLYSVGTDIADPLPEQLDSMEMDEQPNTADWDEQQRAFVTKIDVPVEVPDLEVITPEEVGSLEEVLGEDLEVEEETSDDPVPAETLS